MTLRLPTVRRRRAAGFTLIELMVAMLLGLIVIAGVGSVFIASQRSYTTNEALSDVQDSSRIAFEMLARDIRRAGDTGCDSSGRVANVLNNSASDWWANWGNSLVGYEPGQADPAAPIGSATGQRVAGTDSMMILGVANNGLSVESHQPTSAQFKLNDKSSDLNDGDIIVVCDPDHATLVQITNYNNSNVTLVHDTGNGVATPGNCSKGLGYPTTCTTNGNEYEFPKNSAVAKLTALDWFIGHNPVGGRSLYQVHIQNLSGVPQPTAAQEMVRNVNDMQIAYHNVGGTVFQDATAVTDWTTVDAVKVTLTVVSANQKAGTDNKPISRKFTATTTVRNRVL